MSVLPDEVADHLDKVVAATRLLPSTDRIQALDTAVSMLQAEQASATRELASDGSLAGSGCKTIGSWLRVHLRRGIGAHRITRRAELLPQLPGLGRRRRARGPWAWQRQPIEAVPARHASRSWCDDQA
jgi:hypothetical protein